MGRKQSIDILLYKSVLCAVFKYELLYGTQSCQTENSQLCIWISRIEDEALHINVLAGKWNYIFFKSQAPKAISLHFSMGHLLASFNSAMRFTSCGGYLPDSWVTSPMASRTENFINVASVKGWIEHRYVPPFSCGETYGPRLVCRCISGHLRNRPITSLTFSTADDSAD